MSVCLSVCLSVCVSVCPSVRLFTFEVPFKRLFAPTSRSWMSNTFRDSESLGKSNGKSDLIFEHFGLKIVKNRPAKKIVFFADFALQNMVETMLPDGLETSGRRAFR